MNDLTDLDETLKVLNNTAQTIVDIKDVEYTVQDIFNKFNKKIESIQQTANNTLKLNAPSTYMIGYYEGLVHSLELLGVRDYNIKTKTNLDSFNILTQEEIDNLLYDDETEEHNKKEKDTTKLKCKNCKYFKPLFRENSKIKGQCELGVDIMFESNHCGKWVDKNVKYV